MIVSWISHDNRKLRRSKAKRAKRAGLNVAIRRATTEEIGQHIVALTVYLTSPNKARLDELVAIETVRQHVVRYIGSEKTDDGEEVSEAEIAAARDAADNERVRQVLTRNLLSTELADLQFEMALVTGLSPGGEDPIEHIVVSWPEGEHPSEEQVEETLDVILSCAGMNRHQVFAVLHGDTSNVHLHIALNRIDPVTGQRVQIGLDLERSIETLHQSIAVIEYRQNWAPEAGGLYRADDNGCYERSSGIKVRDAAMYPCASSADQKRIRTLRAAEKLERRISSAARDFERRTGFESLQRRVIDTAAPIFKDAARWDAVHRDLASEGMRFRMLKEGAVIECGERTIAASTAWGGASAAKMIERLGAFEDCSPDLEVAPFEDRVIPNLRRVVEKRRALYAIRQAQKGLNASVAHAHDIVGDRYARQVAADPRSRASALNDARRDASGELKPLNEAIEHLAVRERERLRRIRRALAEERLVDVEIDDDQDAPAGILIGEDARIAPLQRPPAIPEYGFCGVERDEHFAYYRGAQLAFVERLDRIDLHLTDDEAVRVALRIAAAKWGAVAGIGDRPFLDRLARIAVEEGVELTNPELKKEIQRLRRQRAEHMAASVCDATPDPTPVAAPVSKPLAHVPDILRDYAPDFTEWLRLRADTSVHPAKVNRRAAMIVKDAELKRQLAELESQQFAFALELRRAARRDRLPALDFLREPDDDELDLVSMYMPPIWERLSELPSFPGVKLDRETLKELGVTFADDAPEAPAPSVEVSIESQRDDHTGDEGDQTLPDAGSGADTNDPAEVNPQPSDDAVPMPAPVSIFTEFEQNHREFVAWQAERHRARIDRSIENALAQRFGANGNITPYAARLLQKIADGFDPARVPTNVGIVGQILDQRDANEIAMMARAPGFTTIVDAAKRREPAQIAQIARVVRWSGERSDMFGRVGVENDRLQFGTVGKRPTGDWRTPLEWANRMLPLILENRVPLTRHGGLVGIYDDKVLQLSKENFVGLLNPSIQHALDVAERLQREEERAILAKVQTGLLKIETRMPKVRASEPARTSVRLLNGTPEEDNFFDRRRSDANFYFKCREAASAGSVAVPPLRHDSAVVRAWLQARDDASAEVRELLAGRVLEQKADLATTGMTATDALALAALLKPPPSLVKTPRRRGGPRNRPPSQPGHGYTR